MACNRCVAPAENPRSDTELLLCSGIDDDLLALLYAVMHVVWTGDLIAWDYADWSALLVSTAPK